DGGGGAEPRRPLSRCASAGRAPGSTGKPSGQIIRASMRTSSGRLVLLLLVTPAAAWAGAPDEPDDPKLARAGRASRAAEEHASASVKLSYRRFEVRNLDGSDLPFHAGQLDLYAVSRRWIRIGIEAELGTASGKVDGGASGAWYLAAG